MPRNNAQCEISGVVVTGQGAASRLGFPTINIDYGAQAIDVPVGIYAGILKLGDKEYQGVICLGPASQSNILKLEIHCFENVPIQPDGRVTCIFFEKLSGFAPGDENFMKQKIAEDVRMAKAFFETLQ